MTDIWSFLLQTLTASGAALLLLAVKAMFRDKLSPRWQFAAWGILGVVLLMPAGMGKRYVLVNWRFFIEMLKSALTGEYGTLSRVLAPVPLPFWGMQNSVFGWLYAVYVAGAVFSLIRYVVSYVRLRRLLGRGKAAEDGRIRAVAERYRLEVCPAVEVEGLSSAFICGVFRPVLALPAGAQTDEKVILHELLHFRYRDSLWGIVICAFRCIHWCNPLLWFSANLAGNDLEALCDQRVLERLEGEERRSYGHILLSMADEKHARVPGTSSMANGGRNIRRRIEAIVRFRKYPKGMALASVCISLVLAASLLAGTRAEAGDRGWHILFGKVDAAMALARTEWCTTYAGALDTYAKAVLTDNIVYRAMCAPLSEQNELAEKYQKGTEGNFGLPGSPRIQSGYRIFNLTSAEEDVYEGLLVVELSRPSAEELQDGNGGVRLAAQAVRAEKQGERWVVWPQEEFWTAYSNWDFQNLNHAALPALVYEAQAGDFLIQMRWQTSAYVDSSSQDKNGAALGNSGLFPSAFLDTMPWPDGSFTVMAGEELFALYVGDPAEKGKYTRIGWSVAILWEGGERPSLPWADWSGSDSFSSGSSWSGDGSQTEGSGSSRYGSASRSEPDGSGNGSWFSGSSDGSMRGNMFLGEDWEDRLFLGGGSVGTHIPDSYAMDFYLDGELAAKLTLRISSDKAPNDYDASADGRGRFYEEK